ncbi:MAG: N-acetylmuramoyl-L-alanine amidase [Bacteroidota bacterium]|nr:N-acetylmuramoyl-L-alanine amidase [Bacteroidota bacterium]
MFLSTNLNKIDKISLLILKRIFVLFLLFSLSSPVKSQDANKGIKKIVIDPGHGGKDSGTMGTKRYKQYEKHIALAVSLKLGDYIATAFPDIEIVFTRKKDIFLELRERTELANQSDADLFISIHCDGFTSPNASGASVFVMGMSKLKANMDVAMRENSVIYMEDNYQEKYEGFDPQTPESYIVFSLMQNTYLDQSISFAEKIENEFSIRAKRKSRGVKQAPFFVISRVNMPSVLIECGFLTNPKEEDYLNTKAGQDYIASAIFRAFRSYKESIDLASGKAALKEKENIEKKEIEVIEEKKVVKPEIVYKVQIGTYLKEMKNSERFKGLEVEEKVVNGTYKYFVGNTSSKKQTDILKKKMLEKGFNGAFVIAFKDGIRINVKEALSLQKQ